MAYKPRGPYSVRYWSTADGQDPDGWQAIDPNPGGPAGAEDLLDLDQVKRRVRAIVKDPATAPGVYVIVARGDVPCAAFEAVDQPSWEDPDTIVRFVQGSNISWAR